MKRNTYSFLSLWFLLLAGILTLSFKTAYPQWIKQTIDTKEKLNDVVMLDSATALIAGEGGSILKTTDAGKSWTNTVPPVNIINCPACILNWKNFFFINKQNGIIVGNSVLITSDAGSNWQFVNTPVFK